MDRRRFLTAAAGLAAGSMFGCGGCSSGGGNTLKLVSSMPRTGSAKGQTDTIANGIKMAIDEYGGEIAGMKVEYLDWDDATAAAGEWTSDLESTNAKKALADPDVMAYIGPYNSGAAGVSMPILNEEGLLQVSPAVTWVGLTKKIEGVGPDEPEKYRPAKRLTFARVCPTDETQGPMAADFAKDELKVKSAYILDDNQIYGKGVSGLFERRCKAVGVEVLGHEGINSNQQDFTPLMLSIKAKNPGALYFGGTTQSKGGQLAKDMKKVGLGCPLIVPDGCYELSFIESAGAENLANVYATMGGVDLVALMRAGAESEFVKQYRDRFKTGAEFVTKYQSKFGKDPEAYAVYGYEAAKVILEGIKGVGRKDREAILKAVLGTKDFDKGALGKWGFDADGDITLQNLTISRIEDGRFKLVRVVDKSK